MRRTGNALTGPRVLFLDHTGELGGAELCLLDIARLYHGPCKVLIFSNGPFGRRLERAGVEVAVLPAPSAVSDIRREGTAVRSLLAVPAVLGLARRVARAARAHDVLYANSQKAFIVGSLAGRMAGKPVIWHLHDVLTADHFSSANRRLAVAMANRLVSRVVANSEASARAFVECGGQASKVRVVYNGIDSAAFKSVGPKATGDLKRSLGIDEGNPVIGAFSRLAPWKGQHVLLDALSRLPGPHALIVGEALFGEEAYAKDLRRRASSLGVQDRVHFLGFREDVPRLMRLSDVVVHASTAPEPFGRMIVEGMLARRPVVASRAGGALEIVEDGVNGLLVPPGDAEALAEALSGLLAAPPRGEALAERGYAAAAERFSLGTMMEGVEREIRAAVRDGSAQRMRVRA